MPSLYDPGTTTLALAVAAIVAGITALVVVPVVEWAARRGGWVDAPSDERWHQEATPHLGGVALVGAVFAALFASGGASAFSSPVWIAAACLFGVGLADDLWTLGPGAKLGAQLTATGLVLWSGLFFWPGGPLWISVPLTALWVLGLTNALNLLDAMDGVAAGVAAISAAMLVLIAALGAQFAIAVVAAAVAAASAGFLAYNAAPARIFMGDSGSLPLGFLLAVLGLGVLQPAGDGAPLAVPILVLAVPLFDTSFVALTRLARGQSVSEGGVDHVAHRLVRLGWSERRAAQLMWGAAASCGWIGMVGAWGISRLFLLLGIGVVGIGLGAGLFLARHTGPLPSERPEDRSAPSGATVRQRKRDRASGRD